MFRLLALFASLSTLPLVAFGAFVRLKGEGLACAKWPLCYGLELMSPGFEITLDVLHRMLATFVAATIVGMVILAFKKKQHFRYRRISLITLGLVVLQGFLGALSVAMKLHPFFVSFHLLGGCLLFANLVFVTYYATRDLELGGVFEAGEQKALKKESKPRLWMLVIFFAILTSGAANSTSYSGYTCPGFPSCLVESEYNWIGDAKKRLFDSSVIPKELDKEFFSNHQNAYIHMAHRTVAALGAFMIVLIGFRQLIQKGTGIDKPMGWSLILLLGLEFVVGVVNAVYHIPIPVSMLHTFLAASIVGVLSFTFARSTYEL